MAVVVAAHPPVRQVQKRCRFPARHPDPCGEREHLEQAAKSTSKSAVSRRFVERTEPALAELLATDLSGVALVALMVDGVHFAGHLCVVALGVDAEGVKHPLAVVEGSTENTTVVRELLVGLRERGLDTTRPILAVLDGAKALAAGGREVFDRPVIARCQLHKIRNVTDKLPEKMRSTVESRMRGPTPPAPSSRPRRSSRR